MSIPIKNIFESDSNRTVVYNIINVDTGAYLGAAQSSSQPVVAQSSDIDNSTKWSLILNSDGYYNIDSLDNGVLRATGPSFNPPWVLVSTNIEPITFDNDKEFLLEYNEADDTYKIRVSSSNMYLYQDGSNFYSSGQSSITNDTWKIVEVESWWSKDKIDKINLNFELLSNGGMPGPLGPLGVDGNFGADGPQGATGAQGYRGATGDSGPQGISPWTAIGGGDFLTLHPNFQGDIEYQPIRIGIGQTSDEQEAINYQGPLVTLHNHEATLSNLIINSPNSLDFHFKLSEEGNFKKLEIGDINNSASILKLRYDLDTMDYILHNDSSDTGYLLEANQAVSNPIISSFYNLVNLETGSYIGSAVNSTEPLIAEIDDIGDNTKWRFTETEFSGTGTYYNIDSKDNGSIRATGPNFNPPFVLVSTNFEPDANDIDKKFQLEYDEEIDVYRIRVRDTSSYVYQNDDNKFYSSGASSIVNSDKAKWQLIDTNIDTNINNNTNLKFRSDNTKLGLETSNIISNSNFKYTNNAFENKILVSSDAVGNAIWKNKAEVFGTLPIGSIISITTDWFNNTNFYLEYEENKSDEVLEDGFAGELDVIYGRGRENTPFEGWYICNGQKWTDGVIQYDVPNLNSFDFNIDSNNGEQDAETGGNNTPIIIGGYNFEMESTYNTLDNEYTSGFITPTDTTTDQISLNTGGNFDISRNVHIIYLKEFNYYWQTGDIIQVPTTTITLSGPSTTSNIACSAVVISYEWTGGSTDWQTGGMDGITLYNNDLTRADAGWYSKDGISRYWTGNIFSLIEQCPILEPIDLTFDNDVTQLNGNLNSGTGYVINSQDFENATSLLQGGGNANAGWYRENGTYGWRRYWDGNAFLGESFELPYIYKAGDIGASTSASLPACQSSSITPIYYITGQSVVSGITELHKINSSGGTVLVHLNWIGNTSTGDKPLVKIYTQNAPGSGSKYLSLTDNTANDEYVYRSNITTSSTINKPIKCISYELVYTNDGNAHKVSPPSISASASITVHYLPATITFSAFGGTNSGSTMEGRLRISGLSGGSEEILLNADIEEDVSTIYTFTETGTFTYSLEILNPTVSGDKFISIE